ncbi:MAG: MFS transporter [Chloroflexi bacterium]|nr:MFS transporter [Chloroflexota bacterium]
MTQTAKKKMSYGWWIAILAFVLGAYGGATIWHSFTAFFAPLTEEFAWSYTAISLAASLRGAEFGIMDLVVGFLVDRFSIRRIILSGSILVTIGWLILSHVNSLGIFYTSFFIISTGASGISGVVLTTLLTRWFKKRLGLALGLFTSGFAAGGFAVPGIVSLLSMIGFRSVFLIFGVAAFIIGGIVAYFVRDWPKDIVPRPDASTVHSGEQTPGQVKVADPGDTAPPSDYTFSKALAKPAFWIITYACTASIFTAMMVTTHIMPYLEHLEYSRQTASLVAMMIPAISITGRLGAGWISDKVGHRRVLVLALSGQLVGVVLLLYSSQFFILVVFAILFGVTWGGVAVLRSIALRNCFGTTHFGSILGLCMGLTMVGTVGGPLLAGWIFDTTGSYSLAWVIAGILLLTGIPLVAMTK